ncbi:O-antigen ligase family protein [Streptomyces polyrhachis]|uniref:O-antigen ligase family protein n=1 Tax=Streptomyces polyrhachis TaxID=1282885 RepID=A0ABW2GPV7_9ACTN
MPRLLRRWAPVLPVLLVLVLIGLPGMPASSATPADAACALLVGCAVVSAVRRASRPLTRSAAIVLGAPVIGIAVAVAGAPTAAEGLTGMGRYLQVFVLVPAAMVLLLRDRRDARLVAWAMVALALWEGGVGVHQYLTATGASYQGEYIRAVGTFGPTDVMGMSAVVSYGLVTAAALALGTRERTPRLIATGCALALLAPLGMSFSRGSWIATTAACLALLLLGGLRRAATVLVTVVAALVVLVGGLGFGTAMMQERIDSITQVSAAPDQSVMDRYALWSAARAMWAEHPVVGVGLRDFPAHRDGHAPLALDSASDTEGAGRAYYRQPLLSPHNMYLLILSEQGLLGLVTMAGSWLALLVGALRRLHAHRGAGRDCALAACGLLVWQILDFGYADIGGASTTLTALGFGLAAWWALSPAAAPTGAPRVSEAPR